VLYAIVTAVTKSAVLSNFVRHYIEIADPGNPQSWEAIRPYLPIDLRIDRDFNNGVTVIFMIAEARRCCELASNIRIRTKLKRHEFLVADNCVTFPPFRHLLLFKTTLSE